MMESRALHVAKFEFARYFDLKAELLGLVILVLIACFRFGGDALMKIGGKTPVTVAVETAQPVALMDLSTTRYLIRSTVPAQRDQMLAELREGRLGALLTPSSESVSEYTVHVADAGAWGESLKSDLIPVAMRLTGGAHSIPTGVLDILSAGPAYTVKVHLPVQDRAGPFVMAASMVLMLIVVLSVISALNVIIQGIAGEKSGRISEMVLSAIPAAVWVDGKLIAAVLHGCKSLLIYAAYAVAAGWLTGFIGSGEVMQLWNHAFHLSVVVLMCLGGVLFWSCVFAGICATLSAAHSPVRNALNFVPMTAFALVLGGINDPANPFMIFLSYLPVTSMFAMPALLLQGQATVGEVGLSFALLLTACWLLRGMAIHAFRSSAMSASQPRSLIEMFRRSSAGA